MEKNKNRKIKNKLENTILWNVDMNKIKKNWKIKKLKKYNIVCVR